MPSVLRWAVRESKLRNLRGCPEEVVKTLRPYRQTTTRCISKLPGSTSAITISMTAHLCRSSTNSSCFTALAGCARRDDAGAAAVLVLDRVEREVGVAFVVVLGLGRTAELMGKRGWLG